MKVTDLSLQVRNPSRVNIFVDGKYRLSLDLAQVTDLGIKKGRELSEEDIAELESESEYGKLYARALEYSFGRPHSVKEVRDYLQRKTREQKYKSRKTGEVMTRSGVSQTIADRVLEKLQSKGYVDDVKFTRWWVETRNQTKGSSVRKLRSELASKGVSSQIIDEAFDDGTRNDQEELLKVLAKKGAKYQDQQKLMQYLARQGFKYDDIVSALNNSSD